MSSPTLEIPCPACGARTPLGAQEVFLTCASCDSRLASFRGTGQRHFMLPSRLDSQQAAERLVQELERRQSDAFPEEAEASPLALPFWRVEAGRRSHFLVAHASPYPETESLELAGGQELLPFSPEALEGFEILPPSLPPHLEGTDTRRVPVDLIHVPVWLLRYRLGGAPYHAVVHGDTGELLDFAGPRPTSSPGRLAAELLGFLVLYLILLEVLPGALSWSALLVALLVAVLPPPFLEEMR